MNTWESWNKNTNFGKNIGQVLMFRNIRFGNVNAMGIYWGSIADLENPEILLYRNPEP